jgi:dTDP-4-dehydrorhamnose reductase
MTGTLVIIGGCGELGWEVVQAASTSPSPFSRVIATYNRTPPTPSMSATADWQQLDCSDHTASAKLIVQSSPSAVIYCAVPKHGGANGVGGDAVRRGIVDDVVAAAHACDEKSCRFIAMSTDLVFDGTLPAGERYKEGEETTPTSEYGRYKVAMEEALKEMPHVTVARTSLILTVDGRRDGNDGPAENGKGIKFVVDALRGKLAKPGDDSPFVMFTDELRSSSFSDDLAVALVLLAGGACAGLGMVHLAAGEVTTRWELAVRLAHRLGLEDALGKTVVPGLSAGSGMNRPLNCALDTSLLKNLLNRTDVCIRGLSERLP